MGREASRVVSPPTRWEGTEGEKRARRAAETRAERARFGEAGKPHRTAAVRLCAVCRRLYVQQGTEVVCGACGGS